MLFLFLAILGFYLLAFPSINSLDFLISSYTIIIITLFEFPRPLHIWE